MSERNKWDPAQYNKAASFVANEFGESMLEVLKPQQSQTILDLGCGEGVLTARIAECGAKVVGIDSSSTMIEHAIIHYGIHAHVMDGQMLAFENIFDVVFSNAALHWMPDTQGIVQGVKRALKSNGQFIAECGGFGNIASIVTAIHAALAKRGIQGPSRNPWTFRTTGEWKNALEHEGFRVVSIESIAKQPILPDGIVGWLKTFGDSFFIGMSLDEKQSIMDEIEGLLAWSLRDQNGVWRADYIRVRFHAVLDE